jgi:hypothetical protein
MGGGLEIALHCDYRTLSTGRRRDRLPGGVPVDPARLGRDAADPAPDRWPEGAAGHRHERAQQQHHAEAEAGVRARLADRLFDSAGFLEDSRALLEAIVSGEVTIERDVDPTEGLDEALEQTRAFVDARCTARPAPPTRPSTRSSSPPAAGTSTPAAGRRSTRWSSCCRPARPRHRSTRST